MDVNLTPALKSQSQSAGAPHKDMQDFNPGCNMIQIPTLESEIELMKHQNTKPIDQYLDHCQRYSKDNIIQQTVDVKGYQVQFKDIVNHVFVGSTNRTDITNFGVLFESLEVKMFKDIVFVNNKQ